MLREMEEGYVCIAKIDIFVSGSSGEIGYLNRLNSSRHGLVN